MGVWGYALAQLALHGAELPGKTKPMKPRDMGRSNLPCTLDSPKSGGRNGLREKNACAIVSEICQGRESGRGYNPLKVPPSPSSEVARYGAFFQYFSFKDLWGGYQIIGCDRGESRLASDPIDTLSISLAGSGLLVPNRQCTSPPNTMICETGSAIGSSRSVSAPEVRH